MVKVKENLAELTTAEGEWIRKIQVKNVGKR